MLITQAKLKGIRERLTGMRIIFWVNTEDMDDLKKMTIIQKLNSDGWLTFSQDKLKIEIEEAMKNKKIGVNTDGKSLSERMRGQLYRYWRELNTPNQSFELFYQQKMEGYIGRIQQIADGLESENIEKLYGSNEHV